VIRYMSDLTKNESNSKIICVSHHKDVDGCISAALIKHATQSQFLLANYGNINECLRRIYDTFDIVYICDLGINEITVKEFERIRQFAELTYIDHHPIDASVLKSIQKMGVKVVHSQLDCTGVLTHNLFKADLPREAGLLASYAAVSDRLENGSLAKKVLSRYDRDFILFETMLLSYALEKADTDYKKKLVPKLSKLEYPHQIPGIIRLALEQAERVTTLRRELPLRSQRIGNLCYADAKGDSSGTIANLLIEVCDAEIGIGYDTNEQKQITDLSIRGGAISRINLGKKVSKLAKRFGGTGGGHKKASGARIPTSKLMEFMRALSNKSR
jgi:nanoRNase/pAp phosphatase (c-di-AMP/oligoRNAs hydrolase)